MAEFKTILQKLISRQDLSRAEATDAFEHLMSGQASEGQIAGFLVALASKGASVEEITGAASVMRERAVIIACPDGDVTIDTCGTGGDIKGTFNISTAAAIVVAAAGVRVVKHGNRSASSKTGSADVLEALGVKLELPPEKLASCLSRANLCFAYARSHHPAMKHVAAARAALGVPTLFNYLGPLTNPARAKHQLLGVFAASLTETIAHVLRELGTERAWVVHAEDGLDELSTMSPTRVTEVRDGMIETRRIDARELGLPRAKLEDLQVHDAKQSAEVLRRIFAGEKSSSRDIVLLNAAAGFVIAGKVRDLKEGLQLASATVDSGKAKQKLQELVEYSNS